MNRPSDASIARAKRFHEAYERLAPQFGYETRTDTREFDPESANGRLMIAVCDALDTSPEARTGDCVTIPAHGIETMLSAATLLELSTNPIDRAEGAALRRLTTKATP